MIDSLFKHITWDLSFTLVVDVFGIAYKRDKDVLHLIKIRREKYTFKVNFYVKQHIGINLEWDYVKREIRCSMPGYVEQAHTDLKHELNSNQHQGAPSKMPHQNYGSKIQYKYDNDDIPVGEKRIQYIQQVIKKFWYYS